jgi:hypothetical protein
LRNVIARLDGAGIAYMLTGSVAMSVYAEPRMTRDIDIVVELAAGDTRRVVGLFSPDYYVSDEAVRNAIAARSLFNLFNLAKLVKVDLIVRNDDEFQRHQFARRMRHDLGGTLTWVISKEDLILAKRGARGSESRPCCGSAPMRDTTPEFQRFVDEQYRRLTPGERVRLCTEMFDAARRLVESTLPRELSERECKRRITERFYGAEFAERVFPREA